MVKRTSKAVASNALTEDIDGILRALADIWPLVHAPNQPGLPDFIQDEWPAMRASGLTGDDIVAVWGDVDGDGNPPIDGLRHAMFAALAYAAEAKAKGVLKAGPKDLEYAWRCLSRAHYWCGFAVASYFHCKRLAPTGKAWAAMAAERRHTENRALKAFTISWYKENAAHFKSKDEAAAKAAGAVVPVKFRTVRDWLKGL
jgi:hypothetical protein